jgi:hypothetical protein
MARYWYDPAQGKVVEVAPDFGNSSSGWGKLASEEEIYANARATDGTDISSRQKRREYMKAHGLGDTGDYNQAQGTSIPSFWDRAAERRAKIRRGEIDTSGGRRREAIARALNQRRRG